MSPARLELKAEPGKVSRGALTIRHMGREPANYLLRSSEWDYTAAGESVFSDTLKPQSCRPWLRLERRKISLRPDSERKFRYEFRVPAGTPAQECRLAIMVEGEGPGAVAEAGGGVSLPVKGRLAVIIYVAVGNAKPELKYSGLSKGSQSTGHTLEIANFGNATGRVGGVLRGIDSENNDFDVSASNQPILPGQQRPLGLAFSLPGTKKVVTPVYPVRLSGELFWQHGAISISTVLQP